MSKFEWTLVDTETTGLHPPIYIVELAAQRMVDWEPRGDHFRIFLNHGVDIPEGARRVHGYTRAFLEKSGNDPKRAHLLFDRYAGASPIVSYNLAYDFDKVMAPEWARLNHRSSQTRGFCALNLARRLVDPNSVPNFKLQTLREHFGLPERGAHSALGDIRTVIDLLAVPLRKRANEMGLISIREAANLLIADGYPERLTFGKHKGRHFSEARSDRDFHGWLEWLARQPELETAKIGKWYMAKLDQGGHTPESEAKKNTDYSTQSQHRTQTKQATWSSPRETSSSWASAREHVSSMTTERIVSVTPKDFHTKYLTFSCVACGSTFAQTLARGEVSARCPSCFALNIANVKW